MSDGKVKFIRKNGRVIPIKDNGGSDTKKWNKHADKLDNYAKGEDKKAAREIGKKSDKVSGKTKAKNALIGAAAGVIANKFIGGMGPGAAAALGGLIGYASSGAKSGDSAKAKQHMENAELARSDSKKARAYAKMGKKK